jgi:general stress protein YciG
MTKSNRGFASMDRQKQKEIASKGGRAAHQKGTAHEFTPDEARQAGRKGGQAVSRNREHMARIGRKGGEESGARARANRVRQGSENPGQQSQPSQPQFQPGQAGENRSGSEMRSSMGSSMPDTDNESAA